MDKYYLFLIASIWLFTSLCLSADSASDSSTSDGTDGDPFNGNLETFYEDMSNIDKSENQFVTFFRDKVKNFIDYLEKDKKFKKDAVTKGTEMEKKIQIISDTLKSFTVTLPAALQSELKQIEKHAAAELKKLKRTG